MNSPRHPLSALLLCGLLSLIPNAPAQAGSATWKSDPPTNAWRTAANWSPKTVPNGPSDVATFAISSVIGIFLAADDEVFSIVFPAGASSYTITDTIGTLTISGAGVINNSGATQNFVADPVQQVGNDVVISFINQASAGDATYSNYGVVFEAVPRGATEFNNSATAANATFFNHAGFGNGGHTTFRDASTAANATIFNDAAEAFTIGGDFGYTEFFGTASAANATFTCYGGDDPGVFGVVAYGGAVSFSNDATAAESIFTLEGGTAAQTGGGQLSFSLNSTAANSTVTIGAGSNGGLDAYLYFLQDSLGGRARIILSGTLDMSGHNSPGVTTGSIEGSGIIILGPNNLTVGSSRLKRTFSGTIEDGSVAGGSLSVIGGQLTLTNANTYTGGTTIEGGKLVVNNTSGSATGSGAVQVNAGRLGGRGTISGAVTLGTGSGPGAVLSPGKRSVKPGTLTIQGALTFNSDSTYYFGLKTNSVTADDVVANGVTISGAFFSFADFGGNVLPVGTVLTVIDNTAGTPIAGTFNNLADGSTFTVGPNTFQANYESGDGNDLTLTVVP